MTVALELAQFARGFSYEDLSDPEVHAAKRVLIDMIACAIGAHESDSGRIVRRVMEEQGGSQESTLIGSRMRVPCANATLANGTMTRYLDYNDTYFRANGQLRFGIHSNELIPAVLAVGWHYSSIAGFVVALYAGKLLGLNTEQLANAVGIAGVHGLTLDIIDAQGEPYNMTKNIGLPYVAQAGVMAALLAEKGFTGPVRTIEGNKGFVQTVMGGVYDLEVLTAARNQPALLEVHQKNLAAEHTTQGALNAVLKLVKDHDLHPDDIKRVRIEATTRTANHTGDFIKRYPVDKETADHSLYYLAAIAITDREVGPGQYTSDRYINPAVLRLIDKITVEANPELDGFIFAGIAHIFTEDGRELTCRVDYPKGNSRNPMTDEELVKKFQGTASQFMDKGQMDRTVDSVFKLNELSDIGALMAHLSFA
jgi:2-methylcitrate dehydratase